MIKLAIRVPLWFHLTISGALSQSWVVRTVYLDRYGENLYSSTAFTTAKNSHRVLEDVRGEPVGSRYWYQIGILATTCCICSSIQPVCICRSQLQLCALFHSTIRYPPNFKLDFCKSVDIVSCPSLNSRNHINCIFQSSQSILLTIRTNLEECARDVLWNQNQFWFLILMWMFKMYAVWDVFEVNSEYSSGNEILGYPLWCVKEPTPLEF